MKRLLLITVITLLCTGIVSSQKIAGKIIFQPGQTFVATMVVKNKVSQEAMGNAIDFTADGTATHQYKVTNATADNSTLHHDVKRVTFSFDGMGQKVSFDSDNKKDLDGFFGAPVKDMLSKSYDMIIDPSGKTLLVKPEKIQLARTDDRIAIIFNMLRDVTDIVYPPKKGEASFFRVLPDSATGIGSSWTETSEGENIRSTTTYTLSAVTDSTIVVDFKGNSSSITKAEMRGMPTTTVMNNNFTGQVIADKTTGIIREKTVTVDSNGNTEAMGTKMPLSSKSTIVLLVKQAE